MIRDPFERFEADARARGFDTVLVREWAPGTETGTHTHPFAVHARVMRGEVWLGVGDTVRHLRAGDAFDLDAEVPHAERYGPEGATFWVARRTPSAAA
ncbi:MAG: cupin domain-containing protein [Sphaerotilus sulfidivorans]|uniref:cupin domain-containing protein n=1 Tax=Sphaerotilus sulfidivorans TaxID=639200 RepID=UPI003F305CEF